MGDHADAGGVKGLAELLEREIRVVGFDDGPGDTTVPLAGVICARTRLEGLLWGSLTRDGTDATDAIIELLRGSKFAPQVHVVLTDGITMGGLNVLDLRALHQALQVPVVAVMRRAPDLPAFLGALEHLPDAEVRREALRCAGPIHDGPHGLFQCVGEEPAVVAKVLTLLTDRGKVPEALRLAHLITGAVATGVSGKRA